jgi:hypothetical protein
MLIRHGEKPAKQPEKHGQWDVMANGQSGGGKSLIVQGWQRAGALSAFFAPYQAKPKNPAIATPDYIYAGNPDGESQRPWETVTPLAAWLGFAENTPQFNTTFEIYGGEADMVASVLALSGTVLICWEHDNIMPNIMHAIHTTVPIANYDALPPAWPGVFYLVWVLDLKDGSYTWSSHNQNLIAGDVG